MFEMQQYQDIFHELLTKNFSLDSRTIQKNEIFLAINGENLNGNSYAIEAIKKGASFAIIDDLELIKKIDQNFFEAHKNKFIIVPNVLEFMCEYATFKRNYLKNTIFIGITGSIGKTTTKEFLNHVLSANHYKTFKSNKNFNNEIGLTFSIMNIPIDSEFAILEIGINHQCEMQKLAKILSPNIAIITDISKSHIGNFSSSTEIAHEKAKIIDFTTQDGILICDYNSPFFNIFQKKAENRKINIATFKESKRNYIKNFNKNDITQETINPNQNPYIFIDELDEIVKQNGNVNFAINKKSQPKFSDYVTNYKMNTYDVATLKNSFYVATAIIKMIDQNIIKNKFDFKCFENFSQVNGRGNFYNLSYQNKQFILINQSYNSCIDSLRNAISSAKSIAKGNLTVVIGDILELGDESKSEHEKILPMIDKFQCSKVFMCGNATKNIFEKIDPSKRKKWSENSIDLVPEILKDLENNDTILVKSSHGIKTYLIIEEIKKISEK